MGFTKEIEQLTLAALSEDFDYEALGRLMYFLRSLGEFAPKKIAGTVIDHPEFWTAENPFAPRLAFGVVDHSISFLDQSEQERLLGKYRRQVNLICLAILEYERATQNARPSALLEQFSDFFGKLRFAQTATFEVAHDEKLRNAELAVIIEQLVIITSLIPKLMERLLFRISGLLTATDKDRLVSRTAETLARGFSSDPIDESAGPQLCADLDEVRFRRSFFEQESFRQFAHDLKEMISFACGRSTTNGNLFIVH